MTLVLPLWACGLGFGSYQKGNESKGSPTPAQSVGDICGDEILHIRFLGKLNVMVWAAFRQEFMPAD